MDFIFNSVADVAVMMVLILFCFPEALSGAVFRMGVVYRKDEWYQSTASKVRGMAPWWFFPLAWSILYVLIISAFYIVYRSVGLTGLFGEAIDVMTLLFIFNMILNKLWSPVFFGLHAPWAALIILILMEATAVGILAFMWLNNYITPFWLYIWYPIFGLYAAYLNIAWIVVMWRTKPSKSSKKNDRCDVSSV